MVVSNRNLLFYRSIFSCYVSFRECICWRCPFCFNFLQAFDRWRLLRALTWERVVGNGDAWVDLWGAIDAMWITWGINDPWSITITPPNMIESPLNRDHVFQRFQRKGSFFPTFEGRAVCFLRGVYKSTMRWYILRNGYVDFTSFLP